MTTRQARRARIRIPGTIRTDDGSEHAATVLDLSQDGCRLQGGGDLAKGQGISLAIGTMAPVSAQVKWRYRENRGISFVRPLAKALVASLQDRHASGAIPEEAEAAS